MYTVYIHRHFILYIQLFAMSTLPPPTLGGQKAPKARLGDLAETPGLGDGRNTGTGATGWGTDMASGPAV